MLCIPTVSTHSLGQRSFSYAAPAVWNILPYEIRSSNTISSFKRSLKSYLFQQSYWLYVLGGGEREREWRREREREWETERERERTSGLLQSVRVFFSPLILFHIMGLVLWRNNGTEENTLLLSLIKEKRLLCFDPTHKAHTHTHTYTHTHIHSHTHTHSHTQAHALKKWQNYYSITQLIVAMNQCKEAFNMCTEKWVNL